MRSHVFTNRPLGTSCFGSRGLFGSCSLVSSGRGLLSSCGLLSRSRLFGGRGILRGGFCGGVDILRSRCLRFRSSSSCLLL
jgi:hypothetical protein